MYISNLNAMTTLTGNYTITFTIENTTSTKLSIFLKINEDDFVEILTNQTFGDIEITGERLKKGINQGIIKIVDNTIPPITEDVHVPESYVSIPFYLNVKETPIISNIKTLYTDSNGNYEISFDLTGDKAFTHVISMRINEEEEYKEIIIGQPLGLIKYTGVILSTRNRIYLKNTSGVILKTSEGLYLKTSDGLILLSTEDLNSHVLHLKASDGYDEFFIDYTIEIKNNIPFVSNILVSNESSTGDFTLTYTTKDVETPTLTHKLKIDDGDFNEITVSKDNHCYTYTGSATVGTHTCYIQVSDGITAVLSDSFVITIFASTTSVKEKLRQAKVYCDLRYNDYKKTIDTVVGDGIFNYDLENPLIVKSKDNYILAHSEFTKIHQQALDYINSKKVADAKTELNQEIQDAVDAMNGLEGVMYGIFKDGVLSDSKKDTVRQSFQLVAKEKIDVDNDYTSLYNNVDLIDPSKTNLKTAYDNFILKHNALVKAIDELLNKEGIVDNTDKEKMDTAFEGWRNSIGEYTVASNDAVDAIASKKATDEAGKIDKKWADIVLDPETGIMAQVGSIETSMIERIDGIEIGGKNIFLNTSLKDNDEHFILYPGTTRYVDMNTPNTNYCFKHTQSGNTSDVNGGAFQSSTHVHIGKDCTFSCNAYIPTGNGIDEGFKMFLACYSSNDLILESKTYTFDKTIINTWQKGVITITVPEGTAYIGAKTYIQRNGTAYDGDWMVEEGNKNSAWDSSPLDVVSMIDDTKTSLNEIINENTLENNRIWQNALKDALSNYMENGRYDEIVEIINSTVKQSNDSFNIVFNAFKGIISDSIDGVTTTTEEMQTYFRFDLAGLVLGKTNSPFTLRLTNEKIQFLQNGNEVAYFSNNAMVITDAFVKNSLRIGSFKWIPRTNGNLSFTWFGSIGMTGCSVNPLTLSIATNKQALVGLAFAPVDCDDKSGVWVSSNTDVATVDNLGIVTAKTKGTSNITFRPNAMANHTTTCVVTVNKTSVEGVTIPSEKTVKLGDKFELEATWLPSNCDYKTGIWAVEDTSIIEINNNNIIQNGIISVTNTSYPTVSRDIVQAQKPTVGDEYEIRFEGSLGTGKTDWGIYNSGGSVQMTTLNSSHKVGDYYIRRFIWSNQHSQYPANDTYINIYPMPSSVTGVNSTVSRLSIKKVEDNDSTYSKRSDDTDDNTWCFFIAKKTGITTITFKSNDGGFISRCIIKVEE